MTRRRTRGRCPFDGKVVFTTYDSAAGFGKPIGGRAYWCAQAGGYHVTQGTRGDYDRQRARHGT